MSKQKVKLLLKDSYLGFIENSIGANCFRNLWAKVNGRKQDILKDGNLACAYFVSGVLTIFRLIHRPHATVKGTTKDMRKSGWFEVSKPRKGAVLVWEEKYFPGEGNFAHIGFYIGAGQAISNSHSKRQPARGHWTFNNKRKVIAIFWHSKLG